MIWCHGQLTAEAGNCLAEVTFNAVPTVFSSSFGIAKDLRYINSLNVGIFSSAGERESINVDAALKRLGEQYEQRKQVKILSI